MCNTVKKYDEMFKWETLLLLTINEGIQPVAEHVKGTTSSTCPD